MEPYQSADVGILRFPLSDEDLKNVRDNKLVPDYVDDKGIIEYIEIWKAMIQHVKESKAKLILELGTRTGNSTRILADACKEFGGIVHTVDFKEYEWQEGHKTLFDNIRFVKCDIRDLVWGNNMIDVLNIDADHDGFNVFVELEKFGRKSRVIMLHDVYGEENSEMIMKAIHTWCRSNCRPYIIYPGHCGLAVICERK